MNYDSEEEIKLDKVHTFLSDLLKGWFSTPEEHIYDFNLMVERVTSHMKQLIEKNGPVPLVSFLCCMQNFVVHSATSDECADNCEHLEIIVMFSTVVICAITELQLQNKSFYAEVLIDNKTLN